MPLSIRGSPRCRWRRPPAHDGADEHGGTGTEPRGQGFEAGCEPRCERLASAPDPPAGSRWRNSSREERSGRRPRPRPWRGRRQSFCSLPARSSTIGFNWASAILREDGGLVFMAPRFRGPAASGPGDRIFQFKSGAGWSLSTPVVPSPAARPAALASTSPVSWSMATP